MPIAPITPGFSAFAEKQNEIIAAVNALQSVANSQVIFNQEGATPCTLVLQPGTYVVFATSSAYEVNGVNMGLSIDGVSMSGHLGNDDGGLNLCTLSGVKEVVVTEEDYDMDITLAGSGGISVVLGIAFKIA